MRTAGDHCLRRRPVSDRFFHGFSGVVFCGAPAASAVQLSAVAGGSGNRRCVRRDVSAAARKTRCDVGTVSADGDTVRVDLTAGQNAASSADPACSAPDPCYRGDDRRNPDGGLVSDAHGFSAIRNDRGERRISAGNVSADPLRNRCTDADICTFSEMPRFVSRGRKAVFHIRSVSPKDTVLSVLSGYRESCERTDLRTARDLSSGSRSAASFPVGGTSETGNSTEKQTDPGIDSRRQFLLLGDSAGKPDAVLRQYGETKNVGNSCVSCFLCGRSHAIRQDYRRDTGIITPS